MTSYHYKADRNVVYLMSGQEIVREVCRVSYKSWTEENKAQGLATLLNDAYRLGETAGIAKGIDAHQQTMIDQLRWGKP